jgi:single-strand DNA-binding protein
MSGKNLCIMIGNVGKDPEVRLTTTDKKVATFSLGVSENYTQNGEKKTNTEWINCVVWEKLAEIVEKYVKKGSQLYIEGKMKTRSYEDKNGIKKYVTEILVHELQMLGSKPASQKESVQDDPIDDLPY